MTDRQELWLVLGLIYLAECFRWVRRGSVVFRQWPLGGWQRRNAAELVGNDRGDLHWTFPLPPFGNFLVARGFPWSAGPEGVATWHPGAPHPNGRPLQPANFRRWDEIQAVELEAEKIFVAGQLWWVADSQVEAHRLAGWLKRCAELPKEKREAAVREILAAGFDGPAAVKRLTTTDPELAPLRRAGLLLWSGLLVVLPVAIWQRGWFPALPLGLLGSYAIGNWIAWRAVKLHSNWYPRATAERFRLRLLCTFSPLTAIRAADLVGRNRLEHVEPMALSIALLPPADKAVAAMVWSRDAWFPRVPANPFPSGTPAAATVDWFSNTYREIGTSSLPAAGIDPATLKQTPAPSEPEHTQFCPRCLAQFLPVAVHCQACGGRSLLPLTSPIQPSQVQR